MRALLVVMLTLGSSFAAVALAPTASAAGPQLTSFDGRMLDLVNDARSNAGVPALQSANGLTNLSLWWSGQMADGATGNVLQHNPNAFQQTLNYGASNRTTWGENVAKWNPASTSADAIFNAYMASPGHKANILGASYRFVGIASTTGSNGTTWNTMTFTDKVDPTTATGGLEAADVSNKTVRLRGWTLDFNATSSATLLAVYVNNNGYSAVAGLYRPDVNSALSIYGNHGFDITVPLTNGTNNVCLYAISVSGGSNGLFACRNIVMNTPVGWFDGVQVAGSAMTVTGWSYDPSAPSSPSNVYILVDGALANMVSTTTLRSDVNSSQGITGNHGFSASVGLSAGNHQVCVVGRSVDGTTDTQYGCKNVTAADAPIGFMESWKRSGSQVTVSGWAFDPNASSVSTTIYIYVNGTPTVLATAGNDRQDVDNYFAITGKHGFTINIPASNPGGDQIWVFAIGANGVTSTLLLATTI